jgi:hypothetical protein
MHLVSVLAAGVEGAANGTAEVYVRGSSSRANYYQDFEGTSMVNGRVDVQLDSYGRALIYVNQLVKVVVKDSSGFPIFSDGFVAGSNDNSVEVQSPSFSGAHYGTGASGANQPTTLAAVLDRAVTSFGGIDWKVLLNGSPVLLSVAIATIAGYFENVKAETYGAVGDGAEDDTSAIQAAYTAAATSGRLVFFPPGTYRITATLTRPPGVSLLGCGPSKSIISIDHASNAIETCSPAAATQVTTGLAFGALQAHTGSLFKSTTTGRFLFNGCKLGNAFTVSASAEAYLKAGADSISPEFELIGCEVYMPATFAGQVVTDGTFTATHRCVITGTKVKVAAGAYSSGSAMFTGDLVQATGCYFDISEVASGTVRILGANTSGKIIAVGNEVTTTSGTAALIYGNGGAVVVEHGNHVPAGIDIVNTFTGGGLSSLASRLGRIYEASHGSTSALDLSSIILNYEFVYITVTNNSSFNISAGAATSLKGLAFTLFLVNDAGGASGTFTYLNTSFAGTSSVAGTAPPTSIAAVGTIVGERWVAANGPDGERFYPACSAYAGT